MRVEIRVATGDQIVVEVDHPGAILQSGGALVPGSAITGHTVAAERNPLLKQELDAAVAAAQAGQERSVWLAGWMIRYVYAHA